MMSTKKYEELRIERNQLRDKFNETNDFFESDKLKGQIEIIDSILEQYETTKKIFLAGYDAAVENEIDLDVGREPKSVDEKFDVYMRKLYGFYEKES